MKSIFKNTVMVFTDVYTPVLLRSPGACPNHFQRHTSRRCWLPALYSTVFVRVGGVKLMFMDGDADPHGLYDWL